MGPNGAGKSTLSYVLAGKPGYEITGGEILFKGEDLLAMAPDERAAKGVFLAFQYPLEIPGVATITFLRTALNAQRRKRGEEELSSPDLLKRVREIAKKLGIDPEMLRRPLNVGFSGGEKKRNETLQMALLEPLLCVLDETDSGLDIDALEGGRQRRQPVALERARHDRDHALSAAAGLYRARYRPCAVRRPHRENRRQGARARTRGDRICAISERGGVTVMNAAIRPIRTQAELGLVDIYTTARQGLPGGSDIAAVRAAAFNHFVLAGLPHRPGRSLEVYRPAAADAGCQAACSAA